MIENTLLALAAYPEQVRLSGLDLDPISDMVLTQAGEFLTNLSQLLTEAAQIWRDPHITTEGHGEVTFEWWHDQTALIFFIEPTGEIGYIKASGPNINIQMMDGSNPDSQTLLALWQEFYSKA